MKTIHRIALVLVIIGAINWGLIGFFEYDLVASMFGGQTEAMSRVIYALVGISGLICIPLLFEAHKEVGAERSRTSGYNNLKYETEFSDEADFTDIREYNKNNSDNNNSNNKQV
ncbi:hypothetical protein AM499_00625 [Bacillus sp. FJAT-22090]|uniref:DUF378 domain-containing protein n=1 Tax=Bacillus sp. FJAT-22090 TaxID=1581038 RepID=UPI0006AFEE8C|nr:DUF378 domain-containing protein [Bacillus sp. FJAT-22090]ALC84490.1 hypothetical protein AM499_00625 [Bacillus sp. FJAT-22090]